MEEKEYEQTVTKLVMCAKSIKDLFAEIRSNESSRTGYIFAQIGLIRLYASFEAAHSIIMQGYAIESIVLARFIHEQLAYMYSLRLTNDFEDIEKLQVTKCITKYKERIDYIGNMYGMTSEFVHLDMHNINFYLKCLDIKTLKATVLIKHNDKEIGYTMLLTFVMVVELYLDMIFVFLNVDGLRSNNPELLKKAENIQSQLKVLIEDVKNSINLKKRDV